MAAKLTTYDPAEDLTSDAAIATFMAAAFATADPGYIAHALGVVARAKGMGQIARQPLWGGKAKRIPPLTGAAPDCRMPDYRCNRVLGTYFSR